MTPFCKACHTDLGAAKSIGQKNGYDFLPCPSCGTVTVDPFPTPEQLNAFYQGYKGTTDYRAKQDKKIRRARGRIRRLKYLTAGRSFLDVGCNYGFTVKAAQDLGLDAFGIDMDATAIKACCARFGKKNFEAISVQDYAARGAKAGIIYTSEVIEHVPDPDSFIAAISKTLQKDGILYLTTPDSGHWRRARDFAQWNEAIPPEHITYFTRRGIRGLLEKHGLRVEKFFFSLKPGIRLIARKG